MTVLERLKAAGYDPAMSLFPDSIGNAGSMECERIQIRAFFCRPRENEAAIGVTATAMTHFSDGSTRPYPDGWPRSLEASVTSSIRCWGVCPAPTRCRAFFLAALPPAQSGTARPLPNRATVTAGASGRTTAQRWLPSARLTARRIRLSMSSRVSLPPPALPVWMTAQSERYVRESYPMRAVFSFGTSSSKSFIDMQKYFKNLPFCSCFPRACVV